MKINLVLPLFVLLFVSVAYIETVVTKNTTTKKIAQNNKLLSSTDNVSLKKKNHISRLKSSPQKHVIAFISICKKRPFPNAMGKLIYQGLRKFLKMIRNIYKNHFFDVCENQTLLVSKLTDLLLNKKWYNKKNVSTVKAIITFMPEDLLKVVMSFTSLADFYILPFTQTSDDEWFDGHKNYMSIVNLFPENIMERFLQEFEWKYAAIIELYTSREFPNLQIDALRRNLPNVCMEYGAISDSDLQNQTSNLKAIFHTLKFNKDVSVVFVSGKKSYEFVMKAEDSGVKKYWIILTDEKIGAFPLFGDYVVISNTLLHTMINVKSSRIEYGNDTTCSGEFLKLKITSQTSCQPKEMVTNKDPFYRKDQYKYVRTMFIIARVSNLMMTLFKSGDYQKPNITLIHGNTLQHTNSIKALLRYTNYAQQKSECPNRKTSIRNCLTKEIREIKPLFSYRKNIGFGCQNCTKDSIINNTYGTCKKCEGRTRPNNNKTVCYDPIIPEHIYLACHIVNTLGLGLSFIILFIYIRYRETPVVRSSNFRLTFVQLVLIVCIFIALPILTMLEYSPLLCTVRPCLIGIMLVACVSIMVCKAEKVLTIFYSKTRLTQKDIFDISVRQMFIFGFLITIDFIVIPVSFKFPAEVDEVEVLTKDNGDVYYMHHCSSDKSFYIQITYCIAILILAIIQGYRCRKLPTNYNEGNSIIVGAATTICSFTFIIWFMHSSKYKNERASTGWLCLSTSLIFFLFSLYGPKVYVIVVQPQNNTKEHHLRMMLNNSIRKTDREIIRRKRSDSHIKLMENTSQKIKKRIEDTLTPVATTLL